MTDIELLLVHSSVQDCLTVFKQMIKKWIEWFVLDGHTWNHLAEKKNKLELVEKYYSQNINKYIFYLQVVCITI